MTFHLVEEMKKHGKTRSVPFVKTALNLRPAALSVVTVPKLIDVNRDFAGKWWEANHELEHVKVSAASVQPAV